MRELDLNLVSEAVSELCLDACCNLETNILEKISSAITSENSPIGKNVLKQIVENDLIAAKDRVPMCQDTGIVVVFLELGSEVIFKGDLEEAVNAGVRRAYLEGYLRKSVVNHPLERINTNDNTPAIIHTKIIPGESVKISVAPKGAGSENVSLAKILTPADGVAGIKKFVLDTINQAGGKPCPPIVVGIGIGGNLEKSALLSKEALLREIDDEAENEYDRKLEKELLEEINATGIGPMGFGGNTTALAVKVNSFPCHIASLPVAINIQCHAARHKSRII